MATTPTTIWDIIDPQTLRFFLGGYGLIILVNAFLRFYSNIKQLKFYKDISKIANSIEIMRIENNGKNKNPTNKKNK
jgi:hypothetical protein